MDFMKKRELILKGPMMKVILTLSGPVMLNNLIQTLYNLVDTYFIGWLGTTEIASVSFIWPLIFFMMSIGMGLSLASTSLISQYTGAEDHEKAKHIAGQILTLSTAIAVTIGIGGFFITEPLLIFLQAEGELLVNAKAYLEIIFLGLPTMFLMFSYTSIKTGLGDTYTPMKISAMSAISNMFFDPLFMFGFGFGVRGAAIATVLARAIFGIYAVYTLFDKSRDFHISVQDLVPDFKGLSKIVKIGLPNSLGQSMSSLGFMIMNIFIVAYGQGTFAAFSIGNRIAGLILMPAMGVGSALASIVGQNMGADNLKRAKEAVKSSFLFTTAVMVAGGLVILYFSQSIVMLFSDDPLVIEQGTFYLRVIVMSLPLMGLFQIYIGTFQGSGHTVYAMIMMLGRLWIFRVPLIILLGRFTDLGANSVWYAMIMSNVLICLVGSAIYFSGKWHKKTI